VVCENYGVAATDLFEYWHRITHDVLRPAPPDALVLCIYPGNDLTGELPDNGFDADGRPRREYYKEPGWVKHISTWLNLKSMFALYVQQKVVIAWRRMVRPPYQAPWQWWANPDVTARAADAPVIRRSRALLQAIATECRQCGTKLCILVVGPVAPYYCAKDGKSPLGQIVADWKIGVPVIDIAIVAQATTMPWLLLFPRDGHLNEPGHAFVATGAIPPLRTALSLSEHTVQIR
jgi:ribosomal protein L40E